MLTKPKTQTDHVLNDQEPLPAVYTEKLKVPGIETLHLRPREEIADALSNLLKSRNNIRALHYEIGEYIELTLFR